MYVIPELFPWPPPWQLIPNSYVVFRELDSDPSAAQTPHMILNDELHREMPAGHTLFGLATEAVAVCTLTHKDFVYVTDDSSRPLAIVHLTWSVEKDPTWPSTKIFRSLEGLELELRKWANGRFWY